MTDNEIRSQVVRLSQECVEIAVGLKLIKRPKMFVKKMKVYVKRIERCWGGVVKTNPHMSFGLNSRNISGSGKGNFDEYKHIDKSKTIGGFKSANPLLPRMAVIAHEVAHAIDHWNKDTGWGAHKETWRFIYGQLRRKWVNPLIV